MAPYPESESMAVKRMRVALKKRNWDLFEQGIFKANEMHESGYKWANAAQWQDLMKLAESEYIPPELWDKFADLVKNIIKNIDNETQKNSFSVYEEEMEEIETLSQSEIVVFFNQLVEPIHYSAIKKHRVTLNNLMYNPNRYEPEHKWFEELSRLINSLDKPNNELTGFLSLISMCKNPGAVITSSYDTNIIKNFIKSNIDFSIPDIKIALNPDKNWEVYPLGGISCSFICSSCGHRALKTDFSSRAIVGSCSRCASPTYPDILDTSGERPEVNPKVWYQSFSRLIQSNVWILVNPPSHNEQPMIRDLIKEAAHMAKVEKIYIVTSRGEIGSWWKNKLEKLAPNAEIKNEYMTITSLLDDFRELTSKKEQEIQVTEESVEIPEIQAQEPDQPEEVLEIIQS